MIGHHFAISAFCKARSASGVCWSLGKISCPRSARRARRPGSAKAAAAADASARWFFFDRGFIDAAAALEHLTGEPVIESLAPLYRYNKRVFLAPPWPQIYTLDQERRHDFSEAVVEYNRLIAVYPSLGYEILVLPKVSVAERADWILASLSR
jgi:predicted ATPase